MRVVCALLRRDGRVLLTQRPAGKASAGLWEFPGGKVRPGESEQDALARELREELGIDARIGARRIEVSSKTASRSITLIAFDAECGLQQPRCVDVARLEWVPPAALTRFPLTPLDVVIAHALAEEAIEKDRSAAPRRRPAGRTPPPLEKERDAARLPLAGVRILDFSRLLPGPLCTLILADMGAEVIKVEEPGRGDYVRSMPPFVGDMSAPFQALNRGKKSITLDLKTAAAQRAARRMASHVDVVLETFRPGVMKRLGLDYPRLSRENPALVYASISGYGQRGPMHDRAGHDINYLALAGILGATGPSDGPPELSPIQMADVAGGAWPAALSIVAALFNRRKNHHGCYLDIAISDGAVAMMNILLATHLADGDPIAPRSQPLSGALVNYRCYRTADGRGMALGALEPQFWERFLDTIGRGDLKGSISARGKEGRDLLNTLTDIFLSKTRDEWTALLQDADVCCEPILTPEEVLHHPLHRARGMFRTIRGGTPSCTVGSPLPFGREALLRGEDHALPPLDPAPHLGADGIEVLTSFGFTADDIARLREEGGLT